MSRDARLTLVQRGIDRTADLKAALAVEPAIASSITQDQRIALGDTSMNVLRIWAVLSWVALPTVMFGGFSLLQLLNRGDVLTPFQVTWFRAGHAHAGVLLLMSLLYYLFLERTALSPPVKHGACAAIFVGILLQSGGFFVHMLIGQPNHASVGTAVTVTGAGLLATAVLVLAYGLYTAR